MSVISCLALKNAYLLFNKYSVAPQQHPEDIYRYKRMFLQFTRGLPLVIGFAADELPVHEFKVRNDEGRVGKLIRRISDLGIEPI